MLDETPACTDRAPTSLQLALLSPRMIWTPSASPSTLTYSLFASSLSPSTPHAHIGVRRRHGRAELRDTAVVPMPPRFLLKAQVWFW
jgi:hypothetical protein